MTIAEVALATRTSAHTLRYYERIGLILPVKRAGSGHRRYGPEDVRWVLFLRKLHATGMPIRRMLAYAHLQRQGEPTIGARRKLLEEHRTDVIAAIEEQRAHLAVIDAKIRMYAELEKASESANRPRTRGESARTSRRAGEDGANVPSVRGRARRTVARGKAGVRTRSGAWQSGSS